ncbi:MAG: GntR family transcriptional regulator [Planctomycetes bacterium]|nr:GntR family transcriptional regulator [Planctomycetota bacterium]
MWPRPDPKAPLSISAQIRESVLAAIAAGRQRPGDRLPSVRGLAAELLVNPNTVAKVYRDLEREGFLVTRPGSGVDVSEEAAALAMVELRAGLEARARELCEQAERAGFAGVEVLAMIEALLREQGRLQPEGSQR